MMCSKCAAHIPDGTNPCPFCQHEIKTKPEPAVIPHRPLPGQLPLPLDPGPSQAFTLSGDKPKRRRK